jgi:predicted dehydrogenase
MTFVPFDRPVRAAIVGLSRIYDLNILAYRENPDVEVVALVDPGPDRGPVSLSTVWIVCALVAHQVGGRQLQE